MSNGGEVIRTDIKVADDTRSFFSVSLWQRKMAAAAIPGDVVLLQSKLQRITISQLIGKTDSTFACNKFHLHLFFPFVRDVSDVKVRKFGDSIEATTAHCSSLVCIIHPYEALLSEGIRLH